MATKKFAYIKREWKNGRWQYTYPDDIKAKKNVLTGQVKSKGYGSLDTHKHAMKQIERDVERNSSSRNIPSSETSSGKQMSKLQQDKAKYMAEYLKETSAYGNSGIQKKTNVETGNRNWHKQQLKKAETANEHNASGSSKNTREYQEFQKKFGEDRQTLMTPVKTTKKQIRQGIRKAKIKTLKREASKAISRAQDWLKDLFD